MNISTNLCATVSENIWGHRVYKRKSLGCIINTMEEFRLKEPISGRNQSRLRESIENKVPTVVKRDIPKTTAVLRGQYVMKELCSNHTSHLEKSEKHMIWQSITVSQHIKGQKGACGIICLNSVILCLAHRGGSVIVWNLERLGLPHKGVNWEYVSSATYWALTCFQTRGIVFIGVVKAGLAWSVTAVLSLGCANHHRIITRMATQ